MSAVVLEEYDLLGDVRYRSYVTAIDKALKSFEYTSEWADLISALGKLNKVLLNHTKFQVIPRRITISKRLAQCMHPALPSGVHLKALETYDIIFKCIGPSRLSQELFIYSAGLFPLLANAATNVRPSLLSIYEAHFIPLGEKLRPGLIGLLIGVLPGLDEGSDHHERTDSLLQKICDEVEKSYFYGCLWKCILSNPVIRLPAISFIISHFSKKQSTEDQLYVIGTDIDSMVHGLSLSLQDSSILVQRCALDLLLLAFPIHNNQLISSDMVYIVTAAITVVLRRDMSLNRRLFSWLLGEDASDSENGRIEKIPNSEETKSYFSTHSKDLLLEALRTCIKSPSTNLPTGSSAFGSPDLLCFRLLISLLDQHEISALVLDDILIEVFRSLYFKYLLRDTVPKRETYEGSMTTSWTELLKTANLFFATLEPRYLWAYSGKLFEEACKRHDKESPTDSTKKESSSSVAKVGSGSTNVIEMCTLLTFLLDVVSLETCLQSRSEHLPDLMCQIAKALLQNCDILTGLEMSLSLQLCSDILSKIQMPILFAEQNDKDFDSGNYTIDTSCETNGGVENGPSSRADSEKNSVQNKNDNQCHTVMKSSIEIEKMYPHLRSSFSNCIDIFEKFLSAFLKVKVLSDSEKMLNQFQSLVSPSWNNRVQRDAKLDGILHSSLKAQFSFLTDNEAEDFTETIKCSNCKNIEASFESQTLSCDDMLCDAFQKLCDIIIKLSSIPMYWASSGQTSKSNRVDISEVPEWLKLLSAVACFGNSEDVFFTAMSTIFHLIASAQSVGGYDTNPLYSVICPSREMSTSKNVISDVPISAWMSTLMLFLAEETALFKVTSLKLWKLVGNSNPHSCFQASELLQRIHNLSHINSECETVICDAMSAGNEMELLSSQKKFCVLWHLTRDFGVKFTSSSMSVRAFDQCFFRMLDYLGNETGPHKAISQSWLNQSLQRGDIARLMEPILMILLHPDSARVSVQHVNVHSPETVHLKMSDECRSQNSEEMEAKIYAISNVSGNMIYHISDDSHTPSLHNSPKKQFLPLSSVISYNERNVPEVFTEKAVIKEFNVHNNMRAPMSLFVNPFGSLTSLCSDIMHPAADSSHTVSSFDLDVDEDCDKKASSVLSSYSERVVAAIIDEILENVVKCVSESSKESNASPSSHSPLTSSGEHADEDDAKAANKTNFDNQNYFLPCSYFQNMNQSDVVIHPVHSYMLLYCQVYDSNKTMYALASLKSIIFANPKITLCSMATTNISNSISVRGQQLQFLLARHRKSIFGNDFYGELTAEGTTMYRSSTFIETVILSCLYHIRSYYPNLPIMKLTTKEVMGNREVRLLCLEILSFLFTELVAIVKDSGKNFASYLSDLLSRSKVQKTLLHCLISYVRSERNSGQGRLSFTQVIVEFNDNDDLSESNQNKTSDFQDTFQMQLLQLISRLIVIEDVIIAKTMSEKDSRLIINNSTKMPEFVFDKLQEFHGDSPTSSMKYQQGLPILAQPMFLNAVVYALNFNHNRKMHFHWLSLVTSILPFAGRWLSRLVTTVIMQLCSSLESISSDFTKLKKSKQFQQQSEDTMPPDYLVTLIESLTTLCHYCLLDTPPCSTLINPAMLQPSSTQQSGSYTSTSQILSNLMHVFSTSSGEKGNLSLSEPALALDPMLTARRALLSNLPRILSSLVATYEITECESWAYEKCVMIGPPKVVRQHILSFLSPISLNYGNNFIAAMAVMWHEQRLKNPEYAKQVIPRWASNQLVLVNLLAAIKVLPMESLVQTVRNVLKQPPPISEKKVPLDVCTLQLFLAYIQNASDSHLIECWQSLLCLWKDGLQLSSPPVQFHLLAILHEFVQRAPILEDKKSQKELQDITHKLIESCSAVASSSLEQTTWLWRNLAVKPGPQIDALDDHIEDQETVDTSATCNMPENETFKLDAQYSVQALTVLAQFLAPVLDFVYIGEEKDKVVPLLSNIMYYVTPYLKNHSLHNIPSFHACCHLLSSISGYQHTRKAWRKDAFDLLLDAAFFQVPHNCVSYWRAIIDHLMTHDKTTFRDFMARVSVAQSGSLNLFSSKEQEYELRANLLKRLAFVLFCSEMDQYQKYMPDIQERLTECLRLHHVPSVHAEVFLCFRVLLIRMSPIYVTSVWPVIITEMVQIFTQIEYELCTDSEEFSTGGGHKKCISSHLRRLSMLDTSWVANSVNGLDAHNNPSWLHLYLSVCKLLDMAVALPADVLPQFQMYRWAFVGDSPPLSTENASKRDVNQVHSQEFVPHVIRLANLLNKKDPFRQTTSSFVPGKLLITTKCIDTIQALQFFFNTLSDLSYRKPLQASSPKPVLNEIKNPISKSASAPDLHYLHLSQKPVYMCKTKNLLQQIEIILENDFIEGIID